MEALAPGDLCCWTLSSSGAPTAGLSWGPLPSGAPAPWVPRSVSRVVFFVEMGWGPLAGSAGALLPWCPVGYDFLGLREGCGGWLAKDPRFVVHVGPVNGDHLGVLVLCSRESLGFPWGFRLPRGLL